MAEKELGILVRAKGATAAAKDIGKVDSAIGKLGKNIKAGSAAMVSNLTKIGIVAGGVLVAAVGAGARSLADLSRVQQQTAAVLSSTNAVSGQTAESVRRLAQEMEDLTTVDDKVVQAGENMLLTFTNIGGDVFPSATKAMVDMAVAMNGGSVEGLDLSATAIQLGKALNDPIKGVTALRKVGVQLTAEQEKQIKVFVKAGRIEEAQKVILAELAVEFGKAGEAAGNDFGSGIRRLQDAGEDLTMALARGLMPVISKAALWLRTKLADPRVMSAIEGLGDKLAAGGEQLLAWLDSIEWDKIITMAAGVKDAAASVVGMFLGLPDWVKQAVVTGWGLNKLTGGALSGIVGELGKGLIKGVLGMNAAVVNINAATVNGGGGGAVDALARGAKGGGLLAALKAALATGGAVLAELAIPALIAAVPVGVAAALVTTGVISPDKAKQNLADQNANAINSGAGALDAEWDAWRRRMIETDGNAGPMPTGANPQDHVGGAPGAYQPTGGEAGQAIGEAAGGIIAKKMDELWGWVNLSAADQLGMHAGAAGGKASAAQVDATWQREQLNTAQKVLNSTLGQEDKLQALELLQSRLLSNGTAGDRNTAAAIGRLEQKFRQDIVVNVSTSVSVSSMWNATMQSYYAGVRDKIR